MKKHLLICLACLLLLAAPAAAAGGDGTSANPYQIESAAELQSIQNDLSAHYILMNDIDLTGVTWTPIGSYSAGFFGELDGNGYTISNLDLSATTANTALFSVITSGATIKDLTLKDCHVESTTAYSANVAGRIIMSESAAETVTMQNIKLLNCSVSAEGNNAANLVGIIGSYSIVNILDCSISKCSAVIEGLNVYTASNVIGTVSDLSQVNINSLVVEFSFVKTDSSGVGNVIGFGTSGSSIIVEDSVINTCIAESTATNSVGNVAGECGTGTSISVTNSVIENSIAKCSGSHAGNIFGAAALSGASISAYDCTVTKCTVISNRYAGGIAGRVTSGTTGVFTNCTVTDCSILANSYAAGICPAYS